MRMRSQRQLDRDRAKREARRRAPQAERPDEADGIDEVDPGDDSVARSLSGYDE